ncbi:hypothetical protein GCM10028807_32980 [Spirosoma daeguense]
MPDASSTILDVRNQSGWKTERLNDTYSIQFPNDYKGGIGQTIEGPEFSLQKNDQRVYFLGATPFSGAGILLPTPAPTQIDYAKLVLDKTVTIRRDGQTQGILYYVQQQQARGQLYLRQNDQLVFAMTLQYDFELHQEVLGILQTIRPNQ